MVPRRRPLTARYKASVLDEWWQHDFPCRLVGSACVDLGTLKSLPRTTPPFQNTNAANEMRSAIYGQSLVVSINGRNRAAIAMLMAQRAKSFNVNKYSVRDRTSSIP